MNASGRGSRRSTRRSDRPGGPAGAARGTASPLVIESCHSTWVFDEAHRRFRRVLKGLDLDAGHASTEWRSYHSFQLDELTGRFVIVLNDAGNRIIRSRRHDARCIDCGGNDTRELSLDELRALVDA
jgi:hypothetical protein